jgi:hypothetical protein
MSTFRVLATIGLGLAMVVIAPTYRAFDLSMAQTPGSTLDTSHIPHSQDTTVGHVTSSHISYVLNLAVSILAFLMFVLPSAKSRHWRRIEGRSFQSVSGAAYPSLVCGLAMWVAYYTILSLNPTLEGHLWTEWFTNAHSFCLLGMAIILVVGVRQLSTILVFLVVALLLAFLLTIPFIGTDGTQALVVFTAVTSVSIVITCCSIGYVCRKRRIVLLYGLVLGIYGVVEDNYPQLRRGMTSLTAFYVGVAVLKFIWLYLLFEVFSRIKDRHQGPRTVGNAAVDV